MSALQARVGQVAAEVRAAAARQVRTMTVNGKKIKVDPLLPMLTYFRIQQLALTPQQEAAIEIINGQFRPLVQQQRDEARPLGESLASNLRAAQESGDAGQVAAAQEAVNQYSIEQSKAAAELDRKYLQAVKPVLTTEQVQTLDREEELDRPTGRGGHG